MQIWHSTNGSLFALLLILIPCLLLLLPLIAGIGLLKRKSGSLFWGQVVAFIYLTAGVVKGLSIFINILSRSNAWEPSVEDSGLIILGLVGVYAIWVLTRKESKCLFVSGATFEGG